MFSSILFDFHNIYLIFNLFRMFYLHAVTHILGNIKNLKLVPYCDNREETTLRPEAEYKIKLLGQ